MSTSAQIKRDFKKYLVNTKVEFTCKNGTIQIEKFILGFSEDNYIFIYTPHLSHITRISLYYETAEKAFAKILLWHQRLHLGKGLMIQGRVRTLQKGKRKQFIFK